MHVEFRFLFTSTQIQTGDARTQLAARYHDILNMKNSFSLVLSNFAFYLLHANNRLSLASFGKLGCFKLLLTTRTRILIYGTHMTSCMRSTFLLNRMTFNMELLASLTCDTRPLVAFFSFRVLFKEVSFRVLFKERIAGLSSGRIVYMWYER
jgi:hypothetical protein